MGKRKVTNWHYARALGHVEDGLAAALDELEQWERDPPLLQTPNRIAHVRRKLNDVADKVVALEKYA